MTIWMAAVVGGVLLALLSYRWRGAALGPTLLVALLRALALTLLIALLLDAVAGLPRPVPPIVALDVSQSWLRGGDTLAWHNARARVRSVATDTLFLAGDSVRAGAVPEKPTDAATRLRAVARLRGETLERTAQALLLSALASLASAPSAPSASAVAPIAAHLDDLDGSKAIEALLGTVHYPGVTGRVNTANEEIDRLIGEEAMNPHEDA